jgi:DNA-binding CsgD family transcriptional regulator
MDNPTDPSILSEAERRKLLEKLSDRESEVVALLCQDVEDPEIAAKLFISESTVRSHVRNAALKLQLDKPDDPYLRRKLIVQYFCPVLKTTFQEPSTLTRPIETATPPAIAEEPISPPSEEQTFGSSIGPDVAGPTGATEEDAPLSELHPSRFRAGVLIGLGVVIGILIMVALAFARGMLTAFLQPTQTVPITAAIPSPLPTSISAIIATSGPIVLATAQVTLTTEPILPTTLVVDTATPTTIPAPPTVTVTPSPPPETVLFSDNFDTGLNPAWKIVMGEATVADGKLTPTSREIWLSLDNNWANYQMSFDALSNASGTDLYVAVSPRFMDPQNLVGFSLANDRTFWFYLKEGKFTRVNATFKDGGINTTSKVVLTVKDNSFSIQVDGVNRGSLVDTQFPEGKLAIHLYQGAWIDNFKIVQLP